MELYLPSLIRIPVKHKDKSTCTFTMDMSGCYISDIRNKSNRRVLLKSENTEERRLVFSRGASCTTRYLASYTVKVCYRVNSTTLVQLRQLYRVECTADFEFVTMFISKEL